MDKQAVDLEHRVEAQAEVLMALTAAMAKDRPELLQELKRLFANRRGQLAHTPGYPNTLEYAEDIVATASRVHPG